MARTAADATRFTATVPTAYNKAPAATSSQNISKLGQGAVPGETPQQKIARLRAAAAAVRQGKETNFDRVVRTGRRWADRAHRFTAYSLIGLTVVSGVVASFAIGDMLMHNRRKRSEWLANQQAQHAAQLREARNLLASGQKITDDQMLLINRERAAQEALEEQKNKKGIFTRAKEAVFSSVPDEEVKGGSKLGVVKAVEDKLDEGRQLAEQGKQKLDRGVEGVKNVAEEVNAKADAILDMNRVGGPLDREAQAVTNAVKTNTKSWTDWLLRR